MFKIDYARCSMFSRFGSLSSYFIENRINHKYKDQSC
jgi:hypothetical protein